MPQSLLTGQLKTYRVWCLYSSFVHVWRYNSTFNLWLATPGGSEGLWQLTSHAHPLGFINPCSRTPSSQNPMFETYPWLTRPYCSRYPFSCSTVKCTRNLPTLLSQTYCSCLASTTVYRRGRPEHEFVNLFKEPWNRFPAWQTGTQPYLTYRPSRVRNCKRLRHPGIDSARLGIDSWAH